MAHGEATRPLETTNGSSVDTRESKSGDNAILTRDLELAKQVDSLLIESRAIKALLEEILEKL
jgi:hypothetical protein